MFKIKKPNYINFGREIFFKSSFGIDYEQRKLNKVINNTFEDELEVPDYDPCYDPNIIQTFVEKEEKKITDSLIIPVIYDSSNIPVISFIKPQTLDDFKVTFKFNQNITYEENLHLYEIYVNQENEYLKFLIKERMIDLDEEKPTQKENVIDEENVEQLDLNKETVFFSPPPNSSIEQDIFDTNHSYEYEKNDEQLDLNEKIVSPPPNSPAEKEVLVILHDLLLTNELKTFNGFSRYEIPSPPSSPPRFEQPMEAPPIISSIVQENTKENLKVNRIIKKNKKSLLPAPSKKINQNNNFTNISKIGNLIIGEKCKGRKTKNSRSASIKNLFIQDLYWQQWAEIDFMGQDKILEAYANCHISENRSIINKIINCKIIDDIQIEKAIEKKWLTRNNS